MRCGTCLLIIPVLFSLLAYRYVQFMPPEAKEPTNQMITFAMYRISDDVINFLTLFGYSDIYLRRQFLESLPKPLPDQRVESTDEYFDGVKVRVYRPKSSKNKVLPALMFYHGGGFKYLSVETYDPLPRNISLLADIVVVSVEYRLMPEYRYPTQFEDCLKATKYLYMNAKSYNVDPERIGISGDSAGGNLAAAITLKLSKEPEQDVKKPRLQVLLYPVLQAFDFTLPSYQEFPDSSSYCFLTRDIIIDTVKMYAFKDQGRVDDMSQNKHVSEETKKIYRAFVDPNDIPGDIKRRFGNKKTSAGETNNTLADTIVSELTNPYIFPLMATDDDLRKLPSTYIAITEYDPLRDEHFIYAERLKRALGQKVEVKFWPGIEHGLYNNFHYEYYPIALNELVTYLKQNI